MGNWRVPDEKDLAAHISQTEIDSYSQSPEFKDLEDPVGRLIRQVAELVRGYLRRNLYIKLDPTVASLPEGMITVAMDIVVYKMLKRFPMDANDPRVRSYQDAMALLKEIAEDRTQRPESYVAEGEDPEEDLRNEPFLVVNMRPDILR